MVEKKTVKALRHPLEILTRPSRTIRTRHALSPDPLEVSNDQSIRDVTSPRGLSDSSRGFSQPEENVHVTVVLALRTPHVKPGESTPDRTITHLQHSTAKDFSHTTIPESAHTEQPPEPPNVPEGTSRGHR